MIYFGACVKCKGDVTRDPVHRNELYCLNCGKRWYGRMSRVTKEGRVDLDYYARIAAEDASIDWGSDDDDN